MKYVVYFFLFIFLTSCYPKISGVNNRNADDAQKIKSLCEDFYQMPDYKFVSRKIKVDMARLNFLISAEKPELSIKEIELLTKRIKENSDLLRQIVSPQFSDPIYHQDIEWVLSKSEFKFKDTWLHDVVFEKIFINGSDDIALESLFKVEEDDKQIKISVDRETNLIDICNFENSIYAKVRVLSLNYRSPQQDDKRFILQNKGSEE